MEGHAMTWTTPGPAPAPGRWTYPRGRNQIATGVFVAIVLLFGGFGLAPTSWAQDADPERTSLRDASGDPVTLIVVVGAGGAVEYEDAFRRAADAWEQLGQRRGWHVVRIERGQGAGPSVVAADDALPIDLPRSAQDSLTPKEQLQQAIASASNGDETWLVLIGHGTFARNVAKFNLVGPDLSAKELSQWVEELAGGLVFINCSSASGAFLPEISAPNRIIVTATRSGSEYNYARFGIFLAQTLSNISADLDHDGDVSLLEAFLAASRQTERFYAEQARLATEHAMLDDNGDRVGTTADFYRGMRVVKKPAAGQAIDGASASRVVLFHGPQGIVFSPELERERNRIELQLDALRNRKASMREDEYWDALEAILLELAALYDRAEQQQAVPPEPLDLPQVPETPANSANGGATSPTAPSRGE
ncbi:MAG: hypothetical protein D6753_16570 [Planctomycetota bacterium]|nr:MAG: hypothetical protein D6753_16570 [Planctomycetota bacterium]